MANIPISSLPEATTVAQSDYLAIDNGTTSKRIRVDNFNEEATGSAYNYMTRAETAATNAASSAADALTYKNEVNNLITSAQTVVSDAQTYASNAATSAGSAADSASTATNKATAAATSADQAANYAENVDAYAKEAKSWARGGTGTRLGEDTDNSMYYANEAKASEIAAASSESNAATSESNAATSEANAATSESNAATSENNAATSESNAATSATNAATSESNAATSATNAALSETNAASSKNTASEKATLAESWAVGGTGTRTGEDTNNAKYWAEVAAGAAAGGVSSFNGRSGIVESADHDYTASQVDYDNTTSGLAATNTKAAIDEVQGNVSTVSGNLSTLQNSLGTASSLDVATSGDASNTEVVKGDDSRLSNARTPVSHTHTKNDITDFPTLGTAAAKDVPTSGNASTTQVVMGDDTRLTDSRTPTSHTHTVSDITDFPTIPDAVTIGWTGTASASGVRYQRIGIGSSYTEINGTKYMEQTKTLSTSATKTYTFSNAAITANSVIEPLCDIFGMVPESITVSAGSCVIVLPKYTSAVSCKVRIYIK